MVAAAGLHPHTVTTKRLLLRPFVAEDVAAYAQVRSDPDVVRYVPGGAESAADSKAIAQRLVPDFAAQWETIGYGPWAVVEQASGRLLGHAGLRLLPDFNHETEVLYMLAQDAWGRGIATEAARAAVDYAFSRTDLTALLALAAPENHGSLRVMEKVGFVREGTTVFKGLTAVVCRQRKPSRTR